MLLRNNKGLIFRFTVIKFHTTQDVILHIELHSHFFKDVPNPLSEFDLIIVDTFSKVQGGYKRMAPPIELEQALR